MFCLMITNAVLLGENKANELVDAGLDQVMISVDGLEKRHDEIRGIEGTFKRVVDAVKYLISARNHYDKSYPSILRKILRNGVECGSATTSGDDCENTTSYDDVYFRFNVPHWSNYSVDYNVRDSSNATLYTGWNIIGLTMEQNSTGDDRNISLLGGRWNLIGYSSPNATLQATVQFSQSPPVNWSDAVGNGKVQSRFAYYNSTPGKRRYEYTGIHTNELEQNRGYWVYSNEDGNMTVKDSGGSHIGDAYRWRDLMFTNGTQVLNITNAFDEGWIGQPGYALADTIQYYDSPTKTFISVPTSGALDSWEGYFVWSRRNDIKLLRQN